MTSLTDPVVAVGVGGILVCVGMFVGFALVAVRRSYRIVHRAQRIAAVESDSGDWTAWDEVFS